MKPSTRQVICAALIPALAGGCFPACETRTTSVVEVPLQLEILRELHDPPDVVVSVVRREESLDGPHCHAGAACVIFLPFIAVMLLTQEEWDEVTVTREGKVVLEALYASSGELRSAVTHSPTLERRVVHLELPELRRSVVVEIGRVEIADDGRRTEVVTPILGQVDLLPEYAEALAKGNDWKRGALLAEAFELLPGEADAFVLRELAAERSPFARARAVEALCRAPEPASDRGSVFVRASLVPEAPEIAFQALACGALDRDTADLVARAAGPYVCATGQKWELKDGATAFSRAPEAVLRDALRTCSPERRALVALFRDKGAPDSDIAAAMADPLLREVALTRIKAVHPLQRRWVLQGLRSGAPDDLLELLLEPRTPYVQPEEVALILAAAPAAPAEKKDFARYSDVLRIFHDTPRDRAVDRTLRALVGSELGARATMALAARGELAARREVARALVLNQGVPERGPFGFDSVTSPAELAAHALYLGGCRSAPLREHLRRRVEGALEAANCAEPWDADSP